MAKDFTELNDSLVRMRKDDILRAAMENSPALRRIIEQCPFVGFENVRRATSRSKLVSMSAVLNCWVGSAAETPTSSGGTIDLPDDEVANLCVFLNLCEAAWGHDPENDGLWRNLNLMMCMWMFRRLVLKVPTGIGKKLTHFTMPADQFKRCLSGLANNKPYNDDFLIGRGTHERDRAPCYRRLKELFTRRLHIDSHTNRKIRFPKPAWSHGKPA
jgi:hypothetical protein